MDHRRVMENRDKLEMHLKYKLVEREVDVDE